MVLNQECKTLRSGRPNAPNWIRPEPEFKGFGNRILPENFDYNESYFTFLRFSGAGK